MSFQLFKFPFMALVVSVLAVCSTPELYAQDAADTREMQATLRKVQLAAKRLNYSGTFIYQQANQIRTSRIYHLVDAHGETEKLEILDGKPREYLRRNDEVTCYLPDSKTIQIEKNVTQEVFPALLTSNAHTLPESYVIKMAEVSRVAGIACQVISFEPKDALRYAYRLCVDNTSGLLLRAQTLNSRQEVIEQISFTQIDIGEVDKSRLKPSFLNTAQWQIEHMTVQANASSGWSVKSLPSSFKKIREMKRLIPISVSEGGAHQGKPHQVTQMIFSDGLSSISVFIEPDTGNRTEGSLQQGAMTIMGKRQAGHWMTVVGEVPSSAIKQVMSSIEFKPK